MLDAPQLQDDYYLNLLHWGQQNVLGVGLGRSVYLWQASNSQVSKLIDHPDNVCSLKWNAKGNCYNLTIPGDLLAIGSAEGKVQVFDGVKQQVVREMT